ncbi:pirin family protein [Alkalimonas collagenimarina]|uniref:Pirin family protein n=1 Tax=Alkalimonas collagenimarina TaxID=400390 RepID=A0ABT9H1B2_9GAMM|nr:pirin family protein [Alkalimonas collagenimarina]MDP4537073.1 pirin family protein [Alkalimonas collagenimarina]
MTARSIKQLIPSRQVSDGAGVKIQRSLGLTQQLRLDPFLMLDCFGSDQASDYLAGFPAHPHRGFETVTYMLHGHMLHEDHMGNKGHLKSGGVQWMTAGRGIIHSEMPQQESGLMQGFQLWLNLPAAEKMKDAAYVDIAPEDIPVLQLDAGHQVKVIAGQFRSEQHQLDGAIRGLSTDPQYYDLHLVAGQSLHIELPEDYQALVYPYEQAVTILHGDTSSKVPMHQAAVLTAGSTLQVQADQDSKLLVLAGKPIGEPVAQYGPFVMNTSEEIEQAIRDYQTGTLTGDKPLQSIQI